MEINPKNSAGKTVEKDADSCQKPSDDSIDNFPESGTKNKSNLITYTSNNSFTSKGGGKKINRNCALLAIAMLVIGAIGGFAAGVSLAPQSSGDMAYDLSINDIDWVLIGDLFTMEIKVVNRGSMAISIQSISVRKDSVGSTEYVWNNPISIIDRNEILENNWDVFRYDALKGNAPIEFLQPGQTYVVKVEGTNSYDEMTTTAPLEW